MLSCPGFYGEREVESLLGQRKRNSTEFMTEKKTLHNVKMFLSFFTAERNPFTALYKKKHDYRYLINNREAITKHHPNCPNLSAVNKTAAEPCRFMLPSLVGLRAHSTIH